MEEKNKKTAPKISATRIIVLIVSLLILGLLIAGVWIYIDRTNGGTDTFKTFTVEIDGKKVLSDHTTASFEPGEHTAEVDYLFGDYDFNISIKPKNGVKFDYTVNGEAFPWSDETDLDAAFSLEKGANGFTFTVPDSLSDLLGKIHGGTIGLPGELPGGGCIYSLVISSYNEKIVYNVDFSIKVPSDGVAVRPGGIYF